MTSAGAKTDWEPEQTVSYEGKTLYLWTVKAKKAGKGVNFEIKLEKDGQNVKGLGSVQLNESKSIALSAMLKRQS